MKEESTEEKTSGECPMKRKDGSYSFDWRGVFRHGPSGSHPINQDNLVKEGNIVTQRNNPAVKDSAGEGGCPVKDASSESSTRDGCPVREYNVYSQPIDPTNQMPKVANQMPAPSQQKELSTSRVSSGIAKGGAEEGSTWTYPSPQMFYNALARKGKLGDTKEEDVDSLVALHNNMNEKTWAKVVECEKVLAPESMPKLLKFQGRPHDLSPKAWLKHNLFGHPLPYDRHDWTVLRTDGTQIRYVIDYYHDESKARESQDSALPRLDDIDGSPSLVVDVRPALDSPLRIIDRLCIPYACYIAKSSDFEALPLAPTKEMRTQVNESLQVWANIQEAARREKERDQLANSIREEDAILIAESFAKVLEECQRVQQKVDTCESEQECVRASMDLTLCMAKIVCPLQHGAVMKALQSDSEGDQSVEVALENATSCVMLNTIKHTAAKHKFPDLFETD